MPAQRGNKNKAITIYDIAEEAGVSAATVSRVLTDSAKVSPEKRARVMELVDKYNFKPNALAKGLSNARSKMIGILSADVRNPYYAQIFASCEQAARDAGYTVLLANTLGDTTREEEGLKMLRGQQAEAIIQMGGRVDDLVSSTDYVELVNQIMIAVPIVITGKLDGTQCNIVRIDNQRSMDIIMEYLLGLGHRRIALIGGWMHVLSTYEKVLRYKLILQENRIPFDPELVMTEGDYDAENGYELMNKMFDKGICPTAVIAINDFNAIGIMRSIMEHGYQVPGDISLVSYDNTYVSELMIPQLTSVDYNYDEYGRQLVETAIEAIEKKTTNTIKTVIPNLVIRESSGPVRKIL